MQLKSPIGLFGGTFDPIHFGHLRTAIEVYQTLKLAEVRFVPCFQPVHRKLPVATPAQRLKMLRRAIESESALSVDDIEIKRKGPSYTIETLLAFRKKMPTTPLCLMMGIDALLGFASWHRYEEILNLAHLVVVHRPYYQLPKTGLIAHMLKQRLKQDSSCLHHTLNGSIYFQLVTALEISATDIRKQIAMELNPRYLLPNCVYEYIKENGVYNISKL